MSRTRPPTKKPIPPEWRDEITECFDAMAGNVRAFLYRMTRGDSALTEDLMQDTFERATRKWGALRTLTEKDRKAWLIQVAVHRAIDGFRRAGTERENRPQVWFRYGLVSLMGMDVERQVLVVETFIKVTDAMPKQRALVAFLYWRCEWSNAEIAEALGITRGRVSQQITAARATLMNELGSHLPVEPDEPGGGAC